MSNICIAIATYRRPDSLLRLLQSIRMSLLFLDDLETNLIEIIVVDNDPGRSALRVCHDFEAMNIKYVAEPTPGIAAARNRGVEEALDSDMIVFVDDDEEVSEEWLANLVFTQRLTGAELVAGPVASILPRATSRLVIKSGLFDRPKREHRAELDEAGTGNLLVLTQQFRKRSTNEWFQEQFSLTGGSDVELTRRFRNEGAEIRWSASALVWESVPGSRANFRWLARRYRRVGSIDYRLDSGFWGRRVPGFLAGIGRVIIGAVSLLVGFFSGAGVNAPAFRRTFRGIGYIESTLNRGHIEYKRDSVVSAHKDATVKRLGR